MTTVSPTSAAAQSTAQAAKTPAQSATQISSDFETFLQMLTVQMKNQDPLNPIDSADYAVQLATFSGVEQQVQTNDLLTKIAAGMRSDGLGALSNWIGREVPAPTAVAYTGAPLTLAVQPKTGADRVLVEVLNNKDEIVHRMEAPKSGGNLVWDGKLRGDRSAPEGSYSFRTLSYKDGQLLARARTDVYQQVTEVRSDTSGGLVVLASGHQIKAADISAMRLAPARQES